MDRITNVLKLPANGQQQTTANRNSNIPNSLKCRFSAELFVWLDESFAITDKEILITCYSNYNTTIKEMCELKKSGLCFFFSELS